MTPPMDTPPEFAAGVARWHRMRLLVTDLAGFGVLALISLLVGLAVNQAHHQPLPLVYHAKEERLRAAVTRLAAGGAPTLMPAPVPQIREIALEEFQAFAAHRGTVIDARSTYFYDQGHVPGAINLPRESFEAEYARAGTRLSTHKADALAVYCSGADCPDAALVAGALGSLGFRQMLVYREGWDEWSQSGLPQEK